MDDYVGEIMRAKLEKDEALRKKLEKEAEAKSKGFFVKLQNLVFDTENTMDKQTHLKEELKQK